MINPLARNHIGIMTAKNQIPSIIVLQSKELLNHSIPPIRIGKSTMIHLLNGRERHGMEVEPLHRKMKAPLAASVHGMVINMRSN